MPKVFLMTDVVGSTRYGKGTVMPKVLARHDDIVHSTVAAAGGRVFKHTGDGMIAAFDDAEPALLAGPRPAGGGLATESWPIWAGSGSGRRCTPALQPTATATSSVRR